MNFHQHRGAQKHARKRTTRLSGTNIAHVGDHNSRVTLQAIRVHGPVTRTKLVALTGLTPPAIANITNRLMRENLVMTTGTIQGARGQPPTLFSVNPDGCYSIGLNVDRDHLTTVILDLAGTIRARESLEIDLAQPEQTVAFFRKATTHMVAKANIKKSQLVGIGIGIPNMLSHIELPNQPRAYFDWDKVDISTLFAGVVDGPVFIENDATAGALGELQFGPRLRNPSFFYILLNVGLGGGLVIDGIPFRGAHGRSGEFSGVPLRSDQSAVSDLGQAVSLRGLYRALRAGGYAISRPSELPGLDEKGKALVDDWLDGAAEYLLDPLIAMFSFVDPESVVIGGRLPSSCVDRLVGRLNTALQNHGSDALASIPVQRGVLGEDGPAIGAALLPLNERLFPTRSALVKTAEA